MVLYNAGGVKIYLSTTDLHTSTSTKDALAVRGGRKEDFKRVDEEITAANRLKERSIIASDGSPMQWVGKHDVAPFYLVKIDRKHLVGVCSDEGEACPLQPVVVTRGSGSLPPALLTTASISPSEKLHSARAHQARDISQLGQTNPPSGTTKALVLTVDLTASPYWKREISGRHDIKFEVYYNGELAACKSISGARMGGEGTEPIQHFSGRRIGTQVERPWVIVLDNSQQAHHRRRDSQWDRVNASLSREALSKGTNKYGDVAPSTDFLQGLARLAQPRNLEMVGWEGIIDVVISYGKGGKYEPKKVYNQQPTMLDDPKHALQVAAVVVSSEVTRNGVDKGLVDRPPTLPTPRNVHLPYFSPDFGASPSSPQPSHGLGLNACPATPCSPNPETPLQMPVSDRSGQGFPQMPPRTPNKPWQRSGDLVIPPATPMKPPHQIRGQMGPPSTPTGPRTSRHLAPRARNFAVRESPLRTELLTEEPSSPTPLKRNNVEIHGNNQTPTSKVSRNLRPPGPPRSIQRSLQSSPLASQQHVVVKDKSHVETAVLDSPIKSWGTSACAMSRFGVSVTVKTAAGLKASQTDIDRETAITGPQASDHVTRVGMSSDNVASEVTSELDIMEFTPSHATAKLRPGHDKTAVHDFLPTEPQATMVDRRVRIPPSFPSQCQRTTPVPDPTKRLDGVINLASGRVSGSFTSTTGVGERCPEKNPIKRPFGEPGPLFFDNDHKTVDTIESADTFPGPNGNESILDLPFPEYGLSRTLAPTGSSAGLGHPHTSERQAILQPEDNSYFLPEHSPEVQKLRALIQSPVRLPRLVPSSSRPADNQTIQFPDMKSLTLQSQKSACHPAEIALFMSSATASGQPNNVGSLSGSVIEPTSTSKTKVDEAYMQSEPPQSVYTPSITRSSKPPSLGKRKQQEAHDTPRAKTRRTSNSPSPNVLRVQGSTGSEGKKDDDLFWETPEISQGCTATYADLDICGSTMGEYKRGLETKSKGEPVMGMIRAIRKERMGYFEEEQVICAVRYVIG